MNYYQKNNRGSTRDVVLLLLVLLIFLFFYLNYKPIEQNMNERGITTSLDQGTYFFKEKIWDVFAENFRRAYNGLPTTIEERFTKDNQFHFSW